MKKQRVRTGGTWLAPWPWCSGNILISSQIGHACVACVPVRSASILFCTDRDHT